MWTAHLGTRVHGCQTSVRRCKDAVCGCALGAIIKNKYGENSAILAEWTSVSHTERAPRRSASAETPISAQVGWS